MPFLAGRGQSSRGYFGFASVPDAPTLGTITTSINSPGTVSKPVMTQDETNATFTWTSPGATGAALSVPFTAPAFNGGLLITNYEYSTDNGSTWKSAGSTTSPIAITTVSGSSSNLAAATSYTVRLRAVNPIGSGTASSGSARTTPVAVTSYTVKIYDNYPTDNELVETITNTTGTLSRSHHKLERDWSVVVSAVNTNGEGPNSTESDTATGWRYTSYPANYAVTRSCESGTGCDSCGTRTGTEDGTVYRTCRQWTRALGGTPETGLACTFDTNNNEAQSTVWQGNCRDLEASCSELFQNITTYGSNCYTETYGSRCYTGFKEFDLFNETIYMYWEGDKHGGGVGANCGGGGGDIVYGFARMLCESTGAIKIVPIGCVDSRTK
jgi:hypothetical protein